jgi:malonyl-CoA decarboxylase
VKIGLAAKTATTMVPPSFTSLPRWTRTRQLLARYSNTVVVWSNKRGGVIRPAAMSLLFKHSLRRSFSSLSALDALKEYMIEIRGENKSLLHQSSSSSSTTTLQTKNALCNLAETLCASYKQLPLLRMNDQAASCERTNILLFLATECSPCPINVKKFVLESNLLHEKNVQNSSSTTQLQQQVDALRAIFKLKQLCTPHYEKIFQSVLRHNNTLAATATEDPSMSFLLELRRDLSMLMQSAKTQEQKQQQQQQHHNHESQELQLRQLQALNDSLQVLLRTWFSPRLLRLQRITFEQTPAAVLERIVRGEAVHPVTSLRDLQRRLNKATKRVFAVVHATALKQQPLAVVHVSLGTTIPDSMTRVRDDATTTPTVSPSVATFYSISNLQAGLHGVGLGEYLIQCALERLQDEFTSIQTFVTLSPLPLFREWLEQQVSKRTTPLKTSLQAAALTSQQNQLLVERFDCAPDNVLTALVSHLNESKPDDVDANDLFKQVLTRLATHYLVVEKLPSQKPLDPVARFHVGNGAQVFRVNWAADRSHKGWTNSYGIMANHQYILKDLAANQARYELDYTVPVSDSLWTSD